ncbi:MAG TPA: amidohydrolase family protein [Thermoanaerobaculia bacterium]|nr:amidohydrolase family protein [Thermoanaerobaculia bacterium]
MSRLLVEGATLLGLTRRDDIRPATDLFAANGVIRAAGEDAGRLAREGRGEAVRLDARGKWLLPGFVQSHLHLCQTLLRNGPDDLELLPWLRTHVWPGEAAHDATTMSVSARLGLSESLASGVTAVLDMGTVKHSESLFQAAARSGVRYRGGNVLMDDPQTTPENLRASAREGLAETERLRAAFDGGEDGRLGVAVQPRFAVSCTDGLLRQAAEYAAANGLVIHTHASENRGEIDLVRRRTGKDNVEYLDDTGLLTERTCLAHAVHTGAEDWMRLSGRRSSVAHCPSSNMRLASGIAPVRDLARAGVNVALGSDGAACNNSLDPFREMRRAGDLAQARAPSERIQAFELLRMATWNGARALHLGGPEGLVPGGRADFVLLDPEAGWSLPDEWSAEPYGAIVHSMGPANVFATVVAGVIRYRAGDPSVGGLKPEPHEVRDAVRALRSRMG